jgi:hypothetical protein
MLTGGGRGWEGIKVDPPPKIFAKFINKNAIKTPKGVHTPKNLHNPCIPSLPKFGKNLMDPSSQFSNRVHLCVGGGGARGTSIFVQWHFCEGRPLCHSAPTPAWPRNVITFPPTEWEMGKLLFDIWDVFLKPQDW